MFVMRFDMQAPGRTAGEVADLYHAAVEMAAWAEGKGCASIVVSEHHSSENGYLPSPMMLAASIAAVTTTTPIIVAAAILPLYDPVRLAEDMIVLDHLSRGRVTHTLGIGYRPVEYEQFGVDFHRRGAIADEKLATLLDRLRTASAAEAMPRATPAPVTPGGPSLFWGGGSLAAARRAGRNGLGFFANTDAPELQAAYEAAARENGHEPGPCMLTPSDIPTSVFVNPDVEEGWREVGAALLSDATTYADWNAPMGARDTIASLSQGRTIEALRAENGSHRVVTIPEAVRLTRTFGALPIQPLCGGLAPDVAWRYLRRVADDLMPALEDGR
ncbi:LLM class flavin-dependent oxidoreductase [Actinomadura sp. DC4]|uniref:LLM class flavin-dependent oxidoreductase n=1 Tax=Actinomadura sp. DC4 TaxID=3055069 RepID=UPI0025AF9457|nr:LLM class flavin-dependent oxidoreductase [Actinomadura sp. DC4]MDN3358627.1 LLM class flavin-dependent oxidoreductase [Actinomadura sp. DC4]